MQRFRVTLLVTVVLAVVFISCGKKGGQEQPVEDPWKEFTSEEGRFTVNMPGQPSYNTQPVPTTQGTVTLHTYLIQHGVMAYGVMYNDVGGEVADVQQFLDSRRDGALSTVKGTLVSEENITIDGHPGRELKLKTGDNIQYTGRHYLVNGRFYQVIATAPAGVNADAAIKKFLDSFKLL